VIRARIVSVLCLAGALCVLGCSKDEKAPEQPVPLEEIREAVRAIEESDEPAPPATGGPLRAAELARVVVHELDDSGKGAYAIAVRYAEGNRALEFSEAEFTVRMTAARDRHEGKDAIRVLVRNGKAAARERVRAGGATEVWGLNILPDHAIRIALANGLEERWAQYPEARLSAELVPRQRLRALRLPGRCTWVWRIALTGGGQPRECTYYVESATLRFLRVVVTHNEKGVAQ
jgi:hypothetical protein